MKRPRWMRQTDCSHPDLRGIYGDEINQRGGYRLQCRDCGRLIDGPVILAKIRADERQRLLDADR